MPRKSSIGSEMAWSTAPLTAERPATSPASSAILGILLERSSSRSTSCELSWLALATSTATRLKECASTTSAMPTMEAAIMILLSFIPGLLKIGSHPNEVQSQVDRLKVRELLAQSGVFSIRSRFHYRTHEKTCPSTPPITATLLPGSGSGDKRRNSRPGFSPMRKSAFLVKSAARFPAKRA